MKVPEARLTYEPGRLYLSGVLDADTVTTIYSDGRTLIQRSANESLVLDMSRLDASNSSGLALLIDWLRIARQNSVQLSLYNLPQQLLDVARVCGLGDLIESMNYATR